MKKIHSLSAVVICATLVACGGGDPKSASGKPDSLFPDGFQPASSSSSSGSSEPSNIVNQSIPFHENFDSAIDTLGFFSAGYKSLNTDTSLPLYYATGGFIDNETGTVSPTSTSWLTGDDNRKLQLGNGRFTIGQTRLEVNTTTADPNESTWGEFDLSRPYKISFCVTSVSTPSASNFELYVDNNTTGGNNSRYGAGNASRILQVATHTLVPGQRQEVLVPGTSGVQIGSEHSFLQFRVSSGGWAVLDDLIIEYQGEPHGFTLPACVAGESLAPVPTAPPATPSAPTLIAGDGQISVIWDSAGVGATYDILYNTINEVDSALPFDGNPLSDTTATITGLVNGTTYYVFVKARNSSGESDYSESSSATPKEASGGGSGDALVNEDFSAADVTTFFAAAYKSIPGDSNLPLYVATAGSERMTVDGGVLGMYNARFTIGDKGGATNATDQPNGSLDLTKPYRVSFTITEATGTGNIQVYIDNNTTSAGNSIHASIGSTASRLLQISVADITDFPRVVTIESDVGTATSFFQLRADSNVTSLGISDLKIEYQDGSNGGENPNSFFSEDFSAPDTTTFTNAAYKAIPTDANLPMYIISAGETRFSFADGALSFFNGRFTIGDKGGADTNATDQPNGSLDLSKPYLIKFRVLAAEGTGNFQVYVDNNTTSAGSSIHAAIGSTASRLLQMTPGDISSFPQDVEIPSDVGTTSSFLQLRADSNISNLTIDNLTIEYQ